METVMTFEQTLDIYTIEYDNDKFINLSDLNNKLFCTFVKSEEIDSKVKELSTTYNIMYNKMFVLYIKSNDEYVITYNVDQGNVSEIPDNTILVHRKKETNTLYTINALNELIKKLNGGVVDTKFPINWQHYRNCVLLTQHGDLKQLNTKIHDIIDLS
jgi:hypothetical protein|tara:strand:- start:9 stop:482 length:474 start_codon:yes stop_codon:yes gene_type:complete